MNKRNALPTDECAALLKALGDPDRLRIIEALRQRPYAVSKLAAKLRMDIGNISHHLGVLRKAGLVVARREGKQMIYDVPSEVLNRQCDPDEDQWLDLGCCRLELPARSR